MDPKLSSLAAKKLISEYTYLQSDDQLKRELIEQNKHEFLKRVSEKRPDIKESEPEPSTEIPKEKEVEPLIQIESEITKEKIKKLYREIVKKTHPDKTRDPKMIDLYMKATEAHIMNNLFDIYFICNELGISVDFDNDDFEIFKELIDQKRKEITSLEASFIWIYINAPNAEEKDKIVDIYINRYF
jgi:hypothetical protein